MFLRINLIFFCVMVGALVLGSKPLKSFDVWETGVYELAGTKDLPGAPVGGLLYGMLIVVKAKYSFQVLILHPGDRIFMRDKDVADDYASVWVLHEGKRMS